MRKHCIFELFLRFVEQIRAKVWVIVTLHAESLVEGGEFAGENSGGA